MQSNIEALDSLVPDQRLDGRTALVTGSTAGIGEAVARVLASSGARVLVSGRDEGRGSAVVDTIRSAGGRADLLAVDLTAPPAALRDFARRAEDLVGPIDALVNNAGVYSVVPTADLGDDALDAMLSTNIRAPHVLVAALAPAMAERGRGAIVNIGSWMSRVGIPSGAIYTGTKAAIEQMTRTWSAEYGPRGVHVNTVAPGATATYGNRSSVDLLAQMADATIAGVPVRPIDVAWAVRYLVSDEAALIHGSLLDVDGGIANARKA